MKNDYFVKGSTVTVVRDSDDVTLSVDSKTARRILCLSVSEAIQVENGMKLALLEVESILSKSEEM